MKHAKPLSKAFLTQTNGILSLLQLLISLGILDVEDILKKDGTA